MKKFSRAAANKLWLASLVIAAGSSSVLAADLPVKAAAAPVIVYNDIVDSNNQVILQAVATYLNYNEYDDGRFGGVPGTLLDTERGWVPGVGGKASVMQNWLVQNLYLSIEGSYSKGNTHYIGSIGGGAYGSFLATDGAKFSDVDGKVGKGFWVRPDVMITPYFTYGYHQWARAVNAGETYTNQYAGGGVMLQYSPVSRLVFTGDAMVGSTVSPNIFIAANPGSNFAVSTALGTSFIWKVGLGADYGITRNWHIMASADYASFKYGASATVFAPDALYEPMSKSNITTVKVGVGYAWGGPAVGPIVAKY